MNGLLFKYIAIVSVRFQKMHVLIVQDRHIKNIIRTSEVASVLTLLMVITNNIQSILKKIFLKSIVMYLFLEFYITFIGPFLFYF